MSPEVFKNIYHKLHTLSSATNSDMTIDDKESEVTENESEVAENESLPFDITYLNVHLKTKAKLELFETEETRIRSCRLLKCLLDGEKNLTYPEGDWFLLQYLRARKFDVKKAFSLCKNFYHVRAKHVELYDNFDFSTVEKTMNGNHLGFLPYRDSEGSAILIINAGRWNPDEVTMAENMRTLTSGLIHAATKPATQIAGFKVIVDFKGFGLKHFTNLSPSYLWLFAEALQNCFPGRFRAVHIVNEGILWTYIWAILKQVLSKKLRERFQLHGSNMKKLHKFLSPSILPEEYGGQIGPFNNSKWKVQMREHASFIADMYSYGYKKKA